MSNCTFKYSFEIMGLNNRQQAYLTYNSGSCILSGSPLKYP